MKHQYTAIKALADSYQNRMIKTPEQELIDMIGHRLAYLATVEHSAMETRACIRQLLTEMRRHPGAQSTRSQI